MKTMLRGTIAAIAFVTLAGTASAQTNQRHYANNPFHGGTITNPSSTATYAGQNLIQHLDEDLTQLQLGTRYLATADAPSDSETVTPSITTAFALTGSVNQDCSLYLGNNAAARNIDFGVVGVRAGDNENINDAFEMVGAASANVNSATAGCNFRNTLTLSKQNGANGMVNTAATASGYDSNQFQANIPYRVVASYTGVAAGTVGNGGTRTLDVATTAGTGNLQSGAWRSALNIDITAPVAAKALVAGNYADTLTLTLAAQ